MASHSNAKHSVNGENLDEAANDVKNEVKKDVQKGADHAADTARHVQKDLHKGIDHTADAAHKAAGDDDEFPWAVVVAGVAAVAAAIAGVVFLRKRHPHGEQRLRRDVDHHIKVGERNTRGFFGTGQQKFKELIGRGGDYVEIEEEHHHTRNPLNPFDDGDLYKVKQGDSMEKIARKTGHKNWHEIAQENPSIRNPDLIFPGDRIRV